MHGLHTSSSSAEINCYIVGSLYAGVFLVCKVLLLVKTRRTRKDETKNDTDKRCQRCNLAFDELKSEEFAKCINTNFNLQTST